ncbi:MAG: hypothetical protein ACFFF4_01865 [Candidatus Thorarchaeota archaeon]
MIFFDYNLKELHVEKSVFQSAAFVFLVSITLYYFFVSLVYSIGMFYGIIYDIKTAFTWSIFLFLIFPILIRETSLLEDHKKSCSFTTPVRGYIPSRYTLLGFFLAILLTFVPFILGFTNENWQTEVTLISHSISFSLSVLQRDYTQVIIAENFWFFTNVYIEMYLLQLSLLLNLAFCIYLLRYFKGCASRRRTILVGAIISFAPSITSPLTSPSWSFTLPIPLLFLSGLLLMKVISVEKYEESIWEDTVEREWFEDTKQMVRDGITTISVPLWYVILSRYYNIRSKETLSESKLKEDQESKDAIITE